jgi:hypothetical protein
MVLIWRLESNVLIRSRNHVPQLFEPNVLYVEDCCFNCGGNAIVYTGNAEFGHDESVCRICEGIGECFVGYPSYTYYEWLELEVPGVVIFALSDVTINWTPP